MKVSTLKKLGIGIGLFAGGLSTVIWYFDGTLSDTFAYFGTFWGVVVFLFWWTVTMGFSMLIARYLTHTIGIDEDESSIS